MDLRGASRTGTATLIAMTECLRHRGPDASAHVQRDNVGFGFRRLAIRDQEAPSQPVANEDGTVISVCNGEIFNYLDLRDELLSRGHRLQSKCDTDLLPHLYEEYGIGFLEKVDGQFALALYDTQSRTLHLARDQFGVNPLFYHFKDDLLLFGSEIKAILEHPCVTRSVNLRGLDQILTFPGLVSPETMFSGVMSLPAGHRLSVSRENVQEVEFWDLVYPKIDEPVRECSEEYYVEQLHELLLNSVRRRNQADMPVGLYLSGGLDSSLVAAMTHSVKKETGRQSFSVSFADRGMCERKYQERMLTVLEGRHHNIEFGAAQVLERLRATVFHSECPIKDSYNTACYALSQTADRAGVCVALTGQGADELFAGYIGYKFDSLKTFRGSQVDHEELHLREQLWGDRSIPYEGNYAQLQRTKMRLYSRSVRNQFEKFDSLKSLHVRTDRLAGRHPVHQRSYLDLKLRLADHLLGDHGDRMSMAHAVELRHPFLCVPIAQLCARMPPHLKIRNLEEKYILKQIAKQYVPRQITEREKFGWFAPGSPALLRMNSEWVCQLLSSEKIRKDGYFDPDEIEILKKTYLRPEFELDQPFQSDLLLVVITFGVFLETFKMPSVN